MNNLTLPAENDCKNYLRCMQHRGGYKWTGLEDESPGIEVKSTKWCWYQNTPQAGPNGYQYLTQTLYIFRCTSISKTSILHWLTDRVSVFRLLINLRIHLCQYHFRVSCHVISMSNVNYQMPKAKYTDDQYFYLNNTFNWYISFYYFFYPIKCTL